MRLITEVASIGKYIEAFSLALGAKVASQVTALHDPATQPVHSRVKDLATKAFPKQADKITAQVKALRKRGLYTDAGTMGTGKTMQAIGTVHCDAEGKPYSCLVMVPPHLVKKWVKEVHKFLGKKVQASIIKGWKEFLKIIEGPRPAVPTWYIIASTTAKLGYLNRPAGTQRLLKWKDSKGIWRKQPCYSCSKCGRQAERHGDLLTAEEICRLKYKCRAQWCKTCGKSFHPDVESCPTCERMLSPCGEPLYQPKQHKVSPAMLAKARRAWFNYFIRDEAHESKGSDSIDGHACVTLAKCARKVLILTGTLLAGKSEDLRPLFFRLRPKPFIDLGFGWKDEIPFGLAYGRVETVIKTKGKAQYELRKQGKGSNKSVSREIKAGIMPHLFPDFVANYTSFLSLPDLATDLPLYTEETVSVSMNSQQRVLHDEMQEALVNAYKAMRGTDKRMAAKMLGPMLECLLTWPDLPYDRKPVCVDGVPLVVPPSMSRDIVYPKEERLLSFIEEERKQGRKCFVFSDRNETQERLMWLFESHGIRAAHLTTSIAPPNRMEWLEKHAPSCEVGLCNPSLVQTGMELFGEGYNFPTLLWYSTGFRLNTLRQASRRSWRIGQKMNCKTVYLFYSPSAQQKAIALMASKLVAAEAIEGKFSDGGLVDESVDNDLALEVARALADGIEIEMKKSYKPVEQTLSAKERLAVLKKRFYQKMGKEVRCG